MSRCWTSAGSRTVDLGTMELAVFAEVKQDNNPVVNASVWNVSPVLFCRIIILPFYIGPSLRGRLQKIPFLSNSLTMDLVPTLSKMMESTPETSSLSTLISLFYIFIRSGVCDLTNYWQVNFAAWVTMLATLSSAQWMLQVIQKSSKAQDSNKKNVRKHPILQNIRY